MAVEAKRTTVIDCRGKDHAAIRSDPDTVYIGRANPRTGFPCSVWANPFRAGMTWAEACKVAGTLETPAPYKVLTAKDAVSWFSYWIQTQPLLMNSVGDLKGMTLACWCTSSGPDQEPDAPCHGVVLACLADAAPDHEGREAAMSLETVDA